MVHDQSISRPCAVNYATIGEVQEESQPLKPKTFKNADEFTRYIERVTVSPSKQWPRQREQRPISI
jgi:hypothetical protein